MGKRVGEANEIHEGGIRFNGTVSERKDAHRVLCSNGIDENKNKCESMKSKVKKVIPKVM